VLKVMDKFAYIAVGPSGRVRSVFEGWGFPEERRVVL